MIPSYIKEKHKQVLALLKKPIEKKPRKKKSEKLTSLLAKYKCVSVCPMFDREWHDCELYGDSFIPPYKCPFFKQQNKEEYEQMRKELKEIKNDI